MSETEAKFFVRAFTRFLTAQIAGGRFSDDIVESLEVATQCLETAYDLGEGAAAQLDEEHPLSQVNLFEMFVAGAGAEVCAERKAEAEKVKNEGNGLMKEEKFNEAIQAYTRAIALDATNAVFYCNRAAAHSRLLDYQAAAADCRMSLRYDPNYSKAYGRLGIAYSKLNRHSLALEAYGNAIRLDPDNADYQNNMSVTEQRLTEASAAAAATTATNTATAAAGAGGRPPGGLPAGFPELGGLDLGAALSNPDLMNMAQRMISDPAMQDIMQSLQSGGGMESLLDAGRQMASRMSNQNPETFANMRDAFRRSGGPPGPQDPSNQQPPGGPQP